MMFVCIVKMFYSSAGTPGAAGEIRHCTMSQGERRCEWQGLRTHWKRGGGYDHTPSIDDHVSLRNTQRVIATSQIPSLHPSVETQAGLEARWGFKYTQNHCVTKKALRIN